MITCTICEEEKEETNFYTDKKKKNGLRFVRVGMIQWEGLSLNIFN